MEYIYYQNNCQKDPTFTRYKLANSRGVQKIIIHNSLKEMLYLSQKKLPNSLTFLLNDEHFSFFQFDIFREVDSPFSSQDLENIINEKKFHIKVEKNITAQFWVSYIDDIYVNSEKKSQLIGEKGVLMFRIYMIYIDDIYLNIFKSCYGKDLHKISILPQSLYSVLFIKHKMQRENFLLLYINETAVKCLDIKKGFYAQGSSINLGLDMLRQIYEEHGIIQFWNKSELEISENSLAFDFVKKGLTFYSQMLCKRLTEKWLKNNDVFLISSILKNGLFIDIFNTTYKKIEDKISWQDNTNHYIIPFHRSSVLEDFWRNRKPNEMDVLVYLNRIRLFWDTQISFSLQDSLLQKPSSGFSVKKIW